MDYGSIIFDKCNDESFKNRIKIVQYKASKAITRALQGASKEHPYQELGLVSVSGRCRFQKLTFFKRLTNLFHLLISLGTKRQVLLQIANLEITKSNFLHN